MRIKIGDKVTAKRYGVYQNYEPVYYEVVDMWECDIVGMWLKVKHPDIAGYFTKKIDSIDEVFDGEG